MRDIKIVYHKNCTDGMMAAFVSYMLLKDYSNIKLTFIDINPRASPEIEDVENSEIYVFDVTMDRDYMIYLNSKARIFEVYDHHKTNLEDLKGLDFCYFDMNESGATLAWKKWTYQIGVGVLKTTHMNVDDKGKVSVNENYLAPEPPWFVSYVRDRDLWKHELPNSREINEWILSVKFDLKEYEEKILKIPKEKALEYGTVLRESKEKEFQFGLNSAAVTTFTVNDIDYKIGLINSANNQSDLGNLYSANSDVDFTIVWYHSFTDYNDNMPYIQLSLRSVGDFDVSAIAKQLGGGGHKNASGARITPKVFFNCLKKGLFI
jgi:nanoRNase/pAp phosphatase (c-di-AMP/oligoRNAs hydrolase)